MSDVNRCKERMPMPILWSHLGIASKPLRSMRSPFREDRNESFSVFEHDGRWFWKDHGDDTSGDEVDLICRIRGVDKGEAIRIYAELAGVETKAKESKSRGGGLGKIVRVYDYLDMEGNLLHQTVRFDPKNFRQRRPAARGMVAGGKSAKMDARGEWWIWSLSGIKPVLYRLPEIITRADDEVWVVEGEKDADALSERGLLATTCPMGAKKWRPWHTETLAGRAVTVCGDEDDVGREHVRAVCAELTAAGCSVQVVDFSTMEVGGENSTTTTTNTIGG